MRPLSKLQIDTVEQHLNLTLRARSTAVTKERFEADLKKKDKEVKAAYAVLENTISKLKELNKRIGAGTNLTLTSHTQQSILNELSRVIETKSLIRGEDSSYCNIYGKYEVDTKKERAAIDQFILELKLGTALMSDMQKIVDIINKIK